MINSVCCNRDATCPKTCNFSITTEFLGALISLHFTSLNYRGIFIFLWIHKNVHMKELLLCLSAAKILSHSIKNILTRRCVTLSDICIKIHSSADRKPPPRELPCWNDWIKLFYQVDGVWTLGFRGIQMKTTWNTLGIQRMKEKKITGRMENWYVWRL
jgi:hypothetical protein